MVAVPLSPHSDVSSNGTHLRHRKYKVLYNVRQGVEGARPARLDWFHGVLFSTDLAADYTMALIGDQDSADCKLSRDCLRQRNWFLIRSIASYAIRHCSAVIRSRPWEHQGLQS